MKGHPANRDRQIQAVRDSGHDPKVGTWPGDPGFKGDGAVSGRELGDECFGVLDRAEVAALLLVYVAGDTPPLFVTIDKLEQKGLLNEAGHLTAAGRSCVARILA